MRYTVRVDDQNYGVEADKHHIVVDHDFWWTVFEKDDKEVARFATGSVSSITDNSVTSW